MIFNILVSNDDDHLRNHAFVHAPADGGWRLSPLYDVVPKPQIAIDRFLHLSVGEQGRAARLDNALSGAGSFGLLPKDAARIIDRIVRAVRGWRVTFEARGVPQKTIAAVESAFRRPQEIGVAEVDALLP
jgi:serine/threonine-protein kinase HipA